MWTCPKCHQKFVNTNQSHSCGRYSVAGFLKGKSLAAVDLFNYFVNEYKKIGPFDLHPVKTRVALVTQMRFCAINKVSNDFIDVHFVLTRSYDDSSCFHRIDNLADRFFIHHLRIRNRSDISPEVRKFMKLAYRVGKREHVVGKKR